MIINVPYSKENIEIELNSNNLSDILTLNPVLIPDESEIINKSIRNPVNSESLNDFLKDTSKVLVVVNDASRPTPTAKILEHISSLIDTADPQFIVATGIHRSVTKDELYWIFGKSYEKYKDRIFCHDCRDEKNMVYIGDSVRGTKVFINRLAVESPKIIVIGSVEPHYFAGYAGGRKGIIPGLASLETIELNHKLAMGHESRFLKLDGNPVHEDMAECLGLLDKEIFSIMTVLDKQHRLYSVESGDIEDSLKAAVKAADKVYAVKVKEKTDIVVSVVTYPMDIDFYQSQKGISSGSIPLKDGGILILVSKCRDGIGKDTFSRILKSSKNPVEAIKKIDKGKYILGNHISKKIAKINERAGLWAVTGIDPEFLKSIFIRPFNSLQTALNEAIRIKGKKAKVLFIYDSTMAVPVI